MSSALNIALRAILPVWKTTPLLTLHCEAGIPPVAQLLQTRRLQASARLHALDPQHPLVTRATNTSRLRRRPTYKTRLQRTYLLLPECTRPILTSRSYSTPTQRLAKEEEAVRFKARQQTLTNDSIMVFSDGSMDPNNAVGYGYIAFRGSSNIAIVQGKGRLGPAEVIDAEVVGALQGLRAVKRLPQAQTRSQSRSIKKSICA